MSNSCFERLRFFLIPLRAPKQLMPVWNPLDLDADSKIFFIENQHKMIKVWSKGGVNKHKLLIYFWCQNGWPGMVKARFSLDACWLQLKRFGRITKLKKKWVSKWHQQVIKIDAVGFHGHCKNRSLGALWGFLMTVHIFSKKEEKQQRRSTTNWKTYLLWARGRRERRRAGRRKSWGSESAKSKDKCQISVCRNTKKWNQWFVKGLFVWGCRWVQRLI